MSLTINDDDNQDAGLRLVVMAKVLFVLLGRSACWSSSPSVQVKSCSLYCT
jgi:hypothetical protein